ncbi:MAG: DNA alkylation repair protein [Bacteroidota bacterium]
MQLKKAAPTFHDKQFVKDVCLNIETRSLNERMRYTSVVLKQYLSADYRKDLEVLKAVIQVMPGSYTNLLFPDYVAQFGKHDVKASLEALKYFTQFGSSEFAIRVFLKLDFKATIKVMEAWSKDKNQHVRRLASEGSRPRLPWSFKLDEVIGNPSLTRNILTNLKSDTELYVRKSVANHLNDISKEHPDYMLDLVSTWDVNNAQTAWIIKHASRSLIKKGHSGTLSIFNFEKNPKLQIKNLRLTSSKIKLGESLCFDLEIISEKNKSQKLVVDYVIHYRKKLGDLSPKVFKLKEIDLAAGQSMLMSKKQVMKDFTTRKHHAGEHLLEIQVNGKRLASKAFVLVV